MGQMKKSNKWAQIILPLYTVFSMCNEHSTHKMFVPYCCLYFFSHFTIQTMNPRKRPRGTVMTLEETRKSWDEVNTRTQAKRLQVVLDVSERMKVSPSAMADPPPSPPPLGPKETYVKLPRPSQRKMARSVAIHIASEHSCLRHARDIYFLPLCGVRPQARGPWRLRGIRHRELSP